MLLASTLAGCAGSGSEDRDPKADGGADSADVRVGTDGYDYGPRPRVAGRELAQATVASLDVLVRAFALNGEIDKRALDAASRSSDARLGWLISDLLRFAGSREAERELVDAFERVTRTRVRRDPAFVQSAWLSVTNHLISWDLPAAPGYRALKATIFTAVEPGWQPFFDDPRSAIDWRLISWGGVQIDDRPAGDRDPCPRGCIPALDDPELTNASRGSWYPDDRVVFGVIERGDAVAFPKNIMEVHEMVNITIGGRRLGIPYCTLCGSAQAYFTDRVRGRDKPLLLRTSGLLSRSNKVMYDRSTQSVLNTFSGEALSGPLHEDRIKLDQTSVTVSTWGEWKREHPRTKIVAQDGGLGRDYDLDPLGKRDDNGPIFPIGRADPRLPVHEQILGVDVPGQKPLAFVVAQARAELASGRKVASGDVEVVSDGAGLQARRKDGRKLTTHQAFWFAWSQFHPDTELWNPLTR